MKYLLVLLLLVSSLFGAKVVETRWLEGQTFSVYLEERNISTGLIREIEANDRQFLSEIQDGVKFYELYTREGKLLQSLIPVGEEMQIQIVRDETNGEYLFDIIPISYGSREYSVVIPIEMNPQIDIMGATNNKRLANKVTLFFKDHVDCRKLHKGDTLAMIYKQKERLGKPFSVPDVSVAMVETKNKKRFIFADEDGVPYIDTCKTVTYDAKGKPVSASEIKKIKRAYRFGMPLRHIRISSPFTYKRWHPILHRYRPHLGTDFAARKGTPLLAVAPGKVIFSGWKGGYGKVVKIKHSGGYVSLYAHQSRIRAKRGQKVKKGQVIGYVGSTGRSTGPHLHFGLYKNGRAINPMKVLKKKSSKRHLFTTKKIEIKGARQNKKRLLKMLENPPELFKWEKIKENYILVNQKTEYMQNDEG
ncbi:MAG: peptidoglycan DD-metalloendopeptidase family protein [Campylobacterota bacterium]|nr:peptidoglycan DD-metalloendopeptidase family protein [Campylobacterota bacterium]